MYSQGWNPKVIYTLIDKNDTHRLFEKYNGNGMVNPGPGTLIDTALVEQ